MIGKEREMDECELRRCVSVSVYVCIYVSTVCVRVCAKNREIWIER